MVSGAYNERMILFDGRSFAGARMQMLRESGFFSSRHPVLWSLAFAEDVAGTTYAELKARDAESLGVEYRRMTLSLTQPWEVLRALVEEAAEDPTLHAMIVQKPSKDVLSGEKWDELCGLIPPEKDVDGLTPRAKVRPATARAILAIILEASARLGLSLQEQKAIVIGRSRIVGAPVSEDLVRLGMSVENWGRKELEEHRSTLASAQVVVCATGHRRLLNADDFQEGQQVILVDAGAPSAEIDVHGIESKAAFLTPVPGGVGPVTRVCLLENLRDLIQFASV